MEKEKNNKKRNIIIAVIIFIIILLLLLGWFFLRKPSYDITFDSNDGSAVSSQVIKKGDKIEKPEDPVREGYEFLGWFLDLDDDKPFDFKTKISKDTKLYAKWRKIGDSECTLKCDDGYTLNSEDCICVKAATTEQPAADENANKLTLTLSKSKVTLALGQSTTIKATIKPADKNKKVTWKSSNTKVVTVDQNGKITAVGEGTAKVTATVDGVTKTVTVTVTNPDTNTLNAALNSMNPKTIDRAGVNLNYSYSGCTITNTSNSAPSNSTVSGSVATKVYRSTGNQTVTSTYTVTCGSKSATKTVNHVIPASPYTYTATPGVVGYNIIVSGGATNYKFLENGGLLYVPAVGGVQNPQHSGGNYTMVFNSDANTSYVVRPA